MSDDPQIPAEDVLDDVPGVLAKNMIKALNFQAANGGHKHHRDCIHNLSPERQIEVRGKTVEWWLALVGHMPVQITAADWAVEPPEWSTS